MLSKSKGSTTWSRCEKIIVDTLQNNWIYPVDENVTKLASLSTSAAATTDIDICLDIDKLVWKHDHQFTE
jgi:hypothetical protein